MARILFVVLVSLAVVAGGAGAGGGPSPGVMTGWDGVRTPDGRTRYVALPAGATTVVAAVRTRDGRVVRSSTVKGLFGVPMVAFDATTEGLSRDGTKLVLAGYGTTASTRFAIVATRTLRAERLVSLRGFWAFDALSPDARTLYAIEYLGTGRSPRYRVRAVSLVTGKPVGGAIVDKREPDEEMRGAPYARTRTPDTRWAYTLYGKPNGEAFVHALDTSRGRAFCIDLPWRNAADRIGTVRLRLEGPMLVLSRPHAGRLAVVDTRSFAVRSFRQP
jgi:hypothetical protein